MSGRPQSRTGIVGAPLHNGELTVFMGPQGRARAKLVDSFKGKLPPGARFSVHEWPYYATAYDIERDLRDGCFVFVETAETDLKRFPVKPYRLVTLAMGYDLQKAVTG